MTELSRIKKNSFFSFVTIYSRLLVNVILFLFIARIYGPSIFGQFTYAHTLATTFILFADFGFDLLLIIEIAKNKGNSSDVFNDIFPFKFLFSLLAMIGMWTTAYLGSISSDTQDIIMLFSLFVIITALTNFLSAMFKGHEKLHYETIVSLIINISLLILTFFLLYYKVSIFIIALTFVITRLIGLIVSIAITLKFLEKIKFRFNFSGWHKYKSKFLVFGLHLLFGNLFFQLDTILLGLWRNETEVGIYQSVFKLIILFLIVPEVFINALLPVLSRLFKENPDGWNKLGAILNKLLITIVLPMTLFVFIYADQIINFVYSDKDYNNAIPILKIFAVILLVRFYVETHALMLTTSGKQTYRMIVVVTATFINFAINYFMIPAYGTFGAAVTSLITNVLVGLGYIILNYSVTFKWLKNKEQFLSFIVIILMGLILDSIQNYSFWITMPFVVLIYSTYVWQIALKKEEKEILFEGKLGFNTMSIILKGIKKK